VIATATTPTRPVTAAAYPTRINTSLNKLFTTLSDGTSLAPPDGLQRYQPLVPGAAGLQASTRPDARTTVGDGVPCARAGTTWRW
jgi:hypothetical protein